VVSLCERCGHPIADMDMRDTLHPKTMCIAYLIRDLEAERARSWHGWMLATMWEGAHDALLRATLANI